MKTIARRTNSAKQPELRWCKPRIGARAYSFLFYPQLMDACGGNLAAAVMLSRAIQLGTLKQKQKKRSDPNGWFWKSAKDWQLETGISKKMQIHARKILVEHRLMSEKPGGKDGAIQFKVNREKIESIVPGVCRKGTAEEDEHESGSSQREQSPVPKGNTRQVPKGTAGSSQREQHNNEAARTSALTTTENTANTFARNASRSSELDSSSEMKRPSSEEIRTFLRKYPTDFQPSAMSLEMAYGWMRRTIEKAALDQFREKHSGAATDEAEVALAKRAFWFGIEEARKAHGGTKTAMHVIEEVCWAGSRLDAIVDELKTNPEGGKP